MRFAPAAGALALALAITASSGFAADRKPAARAAVLLSEGRAALAAGNPQAAIDAFEAALAVDPAYTPTLIELGRAAQADDLPGKAIAYYRQALARDQRNFAALAGEGSALAQKGALDKARASLAQLQSLCGKNCPETKALTAAIAAGPSKQVMTAEAEIPDRQAPQAN